MYGYKNVSRKRSLRGRMLCRIEEEGNAYTYIGYNTGFLTAAEQETLVKRLRTLTYYESKAQQHRSQRWCHIDGRTEFCNRWKHQYKRWAPHPYTDWLDELQTRVTNYVHDTFDDQIRLNSVLINYYPNPTDYFPFHQDKATPTEADKSWIVSLSIGEERMFEFQRVAERSAGMNMRLRLRSGSLLVMGGACQTYFRHRLCPGTHGARFNLTFRFTPTT